MYYRPDLELLESRLLSATPTAMENRFLTLLNAARADPPAYGRSIGLDLSGYAPAPALRLEAHLLDAAQRHSRDMNDRRFFSHPNPDGLDPGGRMRAAGANVGSWGESLAAGFESLEATLAGLIVDAGVPELGHRRHLLATDLAYRTHGYVGVGIVWNGGGPYSSYVTLDTAAVLNPVAAAPLDVGWVTSLYRDLLGRTPAAAEIEGWRGTTELQIVAGFLGALEYQRRQVTGWYRAYLNREPDAGGLATWTAAQSAGTAADSVRIQLLASTEAFQTRDAGRFLRLLYTSLLGREATDSDRALWLPHVQVDRAKAVRAILQSPEARAHQVQSLYAGLLGRPADPGGLHHFTGLMAAGTLETAVVAAMVGSVEYRSRATISPSGRPE